MIDTRNVGSEDDGPKTTETPAAVETEKTVEPETNKEPTAKAPEAEEGKAGNAGPEEQAAVDESKPSDKKQFSQQEKINFSFSKLKKKHAEETSRLNARISELEGKLKEYEARPRDQYKSEDEYLDAKLDARDAQRQLNSAKDEQIKLAEKHNAEVMRERVLKLYPTEKLQNVYREACELGQKNGSLEAMLGDPAIKKYIFESDCGPLLVEAMSRKPAILQKVLDMADSRKGFYLYDLETRLEAMIQKAENTKPQETQSKAAQAPEIPIVGKVANQGENKPGPSNDWATDAEAFAAVRKMRRN